MRVIMAAVFGMKHGPKTGGRLRNPGHFFISKDGYKMVWNPYNSQRFIAEHILIAEKALGRRLKRGEVVHHWNGVKTDNRNSNLLICTQSYHRGLHERMARLYQQEHFGG